MITSKYRILGGFGLMLFLLGFIVWMNFEFIPKIISSDPELDVIKDSDSRSGVFVILSFTVMILLLFVTQCRYIKIYPDSIVLINPLFPLFMKKYYWKDFNYFITTDEHSRAGTYKAVWIIKDGKVKVRISSFFYSNLDLMASKIKVKYDGQIKSNIFQQMGAFFGMRPFN